MRTAAELGLVVAVGPRGVIGRGGRLPWNVPEDVLFFRGLAEHHALIMGRRTFDEFRGRPPGRLVVVLSRAPTGVTDGSGRVVAAASLDEAFVLARAVDPCPLIAGGASVYRQALPLVTDLWWTDISVPDLRIEPDDTVMPLPQWPEFEQQWQRQLSPRARVRYLRRQAPAL